MADPGALLDQSLSRVLATLTPRQREVLVAVHRPMVAAEVRTAMAAARMRATSTPPHEPLPTSRQVAGTMRGLLHRGLLERAPQRPGSAGWRWQRTPAGEHVADEIGGA